MKNQYVGDINDFRKYGLLRHIQSLHEGSLLVVWMLTPDDDGPDGNRRNYLEDPLRWKHYDPEMYSVLQEMQSNERHPNVELIEESDLLPRTTFFGREVPDGRAERDNWSQSLLSEALGRDLVFLDPDNGIEVSSKPVGRKGSSKHILWQEICGLWTAGCSLLIYQHFPREPRDRFCQNTVDMLKQRTGASRVTTICTPHVLFLLAAHEKLEHMFRMVETDTSTAWWTKTIR